MLLAHEPEPDGSRADVQHAGERRFSLAAAGGPGSDRRSRQTLKAPELEVAEVSSPEAIYTLDRMLIEVMERGTGSAAKRQLPSDLVVAGKTGTSNDYRDSWFSGFSGSHWSWLGGPRRQQSHGPHRNHRRTGGLVAPDGFDRDVLFRATAAGIA